MLAIEFKERYKVHISKFQNNVQNHINKNFHVAGLVGVELTNDFSSSIKHWGMYLNDICQVISGDSDIQIIRKRDKWMTKLWIMHKIYTHSVS